jgi:glycosyltransferase involved in cell wall biosynthesis
MIVKDESDVIARCLESIAACVDEIIIVDTGSSDDTKLIVRNYTDKIYDFKWVMDFAAARNFAFSKATQDFIFWMDADDILEVQEKRGFLELKRKLANHIDVVMMKYNVEFDEAGKVTQAFYRERIFRRETNPQWVGRIHEAIQLQGTVIRSDVCISHKPVLEKKDKLRNLRFFEKMIADGIAFDAREQHYYAQELSFNKRYAECIPEFEKYLAMPDGWNEQQIKSCQLLAQAYNEVGQEEKGLETLYRSFKFDEPRAEVLCDIGKYFFVRGQFKHAAGWYKQAYSLDVQDFPQGQRVYECYDVVPAIHLCACYEKLGDLEKALHYHEITLKLRPNHEAVLRNELFFKPLRAQISRLARKPPKGGKRR